MVIRFTTNQSGNPAGKLADAELHFISGPLAGLKLIGFSVWERRDRGRNVTFPARQYSVNGERRSFAMLRPVSDSQAQDRIRDLILEGFAAYERAGGGYGVDRDGFKWAASADTTAPSSDPSF